MACQAFTKMELRTQFGKVLLMRDAGIYVPSSTDTIEVEIKVRGFKGESVYNIRGGQGNGRGQKWTTQNPPPPVLLQRGHKVLKEKRKQLAALENHKIWNATEQATANLACKKQLTFVSDDCSTPVITGMSENQPMRPVKNPGSKGRVRRRPKRKLPSTPYPSSPITRKTPSPPQGNPLWNPPQTSTPVSDSCPSLKTPPMEAGTPEEQLAAQLEGAIFDEDLPRNPQFEEWLEEQVLDSNL